MAHIHTQPGQHDHTISAYILLEEPGQPLRVLLHEHKKLNRWLQFGGHIELYENPWQALTHEIEEESGYQLRQLQLLQPPSRLQSANPQQFHPLPVSYNTHNFDDDNPGQHYHTDLGYGFLTSETPSVDIGDDESEVVQAFTIEELGTLSLPVTVYETIVFLMTTGYIDWERLPAIDCA